MNYIDKIILFAIGIACYACGSEGNLIPSDLDRNGFSVPEGATDAESLLRKSFFERTGSYLLFDDTLRSGVVGKDEQGKTLYSYELLDIGYSITSSSKNRYSYTYYKTMEEKQLATDFAEKRILNAVGNNLHPYSILVVHQVHESVQKYGEWNKTNIDFYIGKRCLALSVSNIASMTEEQRNKLELKILEGIITIKVTALGNNYLSKFYESCKAYYNETRSSFPQITEVKTIGFLSSGSYKFPTNAEDLKAYLKAFFTQTEKDFMQEYEAYPEVQIKYNLLKDLIKEVGFTVKR